MSDLVTVDPFMPLYAYEKLTDPKKNIVLRQYRKSLVEGVDRLVEKARGRQAVATESDWALIEDIIKFFRNEWPDEWIEFENAVPDIRHSRGAGGYSKSKEIKYVGSIPRRLDRLIKKIFPYQQWDKKFVNSLVKRFKIFKVGGEMN
jgi:hypothetical protein